MAESIVREISTSEYTFVLSDRIHANSRWLAEEAEEIHPDVDDTDGLDPEGEFEAWKLRELMRLKRDREARYAHVFSLSLPHELALTPFLDVAGSRRFAKRSRLVVLCRKNCGSRRTWSAQTRPGKRRRRDSRCSCRSTTTRVSSTRCVMSVGERLLWKKNSAVGADAESPQIVHRTSTSSRSTTSPPPPSRPSPTSRLSPPSCKSATLARRTRPSTRTWLQRTRVASAEDGESRVDLEAERAEARTADVSSAAGLMCVFLATLSFRPSLMCCICRSSSATARNSTKAPRLLPRLPARIPLPHELEETRAGPLAALHLPQTTVSHRVVVRADEAGLAMGAGKMTGEAARGGGRGVASAETEAGRHLGTATTTGAIRGTRTGMPREETRMTIARQARGGTTATVTGTTGDGVGAAAGALDEADPRTPAGTGMSASGGIGMTSEGAWIIEVALRTSALQPAGLTGLSPRCSHACSFTRADCASWDRGFRRWRATTELTVQIHDIACSRGRDETSLAGSTAATGPARARCLLQAST